MKNLRIHIDEEIDAQKYITRAEHDYMHKLDAAIEAVFDGGNPHVITLAGPTCSGKTTTAGKLTKRITAAGLNAVTLSIDDFFLNRNDRNVVGEEAPDYDTVKAIDLDYLASFIHDLLRGKTVRIPHFDFPSTRRDSYREFVPRKNDVYVFEGIQAVYPEVTSLLGNDYRSIFISVADGVRYDGNEIQKDEIRFLRRVIRDYYFRGATPEFTIHLWQGVRENEENNIYPNSHSSDVYIDSFLRYEPFILANHGEKILAKVPADSRYRAYADEMMAKLSAFRCPYFKDEMIPQNSMFREFIG